MEQMENLLTLYYQALAGNQTINQGVRKNIVFTRALRGKKKLEEC
jgi:hypothetical protein